MTFFEVANSSFVYAVVLGVLLVLLIILGSFMVLAMKRAKELKMSSKQITTTVKTTLMVSIGPVLSILVPFLTLMAVLGVPWSWLRLSVVGSSGMEMLIANMSMQGAGFGALGVETRGEAFCLAALAVAVACCPGIIYNIFLNKKFTEGVEKAKKGKNGALMNVIFGSLFVGSICNLIVTLFTTNVPANNWTPIAVFFATLVICFAMIH